MSKTIPPPYIPRVSSYDRELKYAIRVNLACDHIISREEAKDPVTLPINRKQKKIATWDEDF